MNQDPKVRRTTTQGALSPRKTSGWILLTFGLILLCIGGSTGNDQYRIVRDWPSVDAEVISSSVQTSLGVAVRGRRDPVYAAMVEFRYSVGSQTYVSYAKPNHTSSSYSAIQQKVRAYSPQSRHEIRYNPANPSDIRFEVGYNLDFFLKSAVLVGIGLLMSVVSGALLVGPRTGKSVACPSCQCEVRAGQSVCPYCSTPLRPI